MSVCMYLVLSHIFFEKKLHILYIIIIIIIIITKNGR